VEADEEPGGTFTTYGAAEIRLDEVLRESRQAAPPVINPNITVGEYAERWLTQTTGRVRPRTLRGYKDILNRYILPTRRGSCARSIVGTCGATWTHTQRRHTGRTPELTDRVDSKEPIFDHIAQQHAPGGPDEPQGAQSACLVTGSTISATRSPDNSRPITPRPSMQPRRWATGSRRCSVTMQPGCLAGTVTGLPGWRRAERQPRGASVRLVAIW